ncbi:hypothetical protein DH2020_007207 [Rehmannia glutinosa]|uniref:Uncharacterized protein n=1 Tax=Rehmannia glutinosa TaxID=99300 RepID=A0ABR0TXE0_REHGL
MEVYFNAHDALNDVKRSKKKCKQLDSQWNDCKTLVEERNKNIDRDYQCMLRFILGKAEQNKRDRDNVIVIDEEDPGASLVQNQHGSDVQALCSRECNMALNLFVDQARRGEKDKVQNQRKLREVIGGTNVVKGDHEGPKEKAVVQTGNGHLVEYLNEHGKKARATEERKISQRKKGNVVKGKNFVKEDHGPEKKDVVLIDSAHLDKKPCLRENRVTENPCEHADKVQPVERRKVQNQRNLQYLIKGKNVVRGDHEVKREVVRIDNEHLYQEPDHRSNHRLIQYQNEHVDQARQLRNTRTIPRENARGKIWSKETMRTESPWKRTHCETRNDKAAKCLVAHKTNSHENNLEKEGNDPDVEILEDAAFLKNISSFVPSKRFHKSMEDVDFQHFGSTRVCDGFRKQLLDVLKKPFDPEELKRHREAVRDGSYYYYYPVVLMTMLYPFCTELLSSAWAHFVVPSCSGSRKKSQKMPIQTRKMLEHLSRIFLLAAVLACIFAKLTRSKADSSRRTTWLYPDRGSICSVKGLHVTVNSKAALPVFFPFEQQFRSKKCKQLDRQWDDSKKLVEERNIDRDYQRMLRFILGKTEQNKRERDNVIVIDEEDLCASLVQNQHGSDVQALYSWECKMAVNLYVDQAQRGEKDKVHNQRRLRKVVGGTNVVKGDNEALKKKAVVQTGNGHLIEYLNEHGPWARKKAVVRIDSAHLDKKPCLRENRVTENPCEHADKVQPVERRKVQNQRNLQYLIKGKNVVRGDHEVKREVVRIDNEHLYQEPDQRSNHWLIQYQNEHVDQARPVTKYKDHTQRKRKGKNMVKGDNEDRKPMVQIDSENFYRKSGPRNNGVRSHHCERVDQIRPGKKDKVQSQVKLVKVEKGANLVQGDNGLSSQKTTFRKDVARVQLDHNVKARSGRKRTHCEIRTDKAAKCSMAHKTNSHENNLEKEGNDEIDPDVEILEDAAFLKNISSFVPSKRFHKSMEDVDFQPLGSTRVCDGFRKQLLDVLKKPFDPEELKRHREAVRDGSYYYYYPVLACIFAKLTLCSKADSSRRTTWLYPDRGSMCSVKGLHVTVNFKGSLHQAALPVFFPFGQQFRLKRKEILGGRSLFSLATFISRSHRRRLKLDHSPSYATSFPPPSLRSEMKCKQLDSQWDDCKKLVEENNIDCDYRRMLRFILSKAEIYEQHKRERDNVICTSLVQNQHGYVQAMCSRECNIESLSRTTEEYKVQTRRKLKGKNIVKDDNEDRKPMVQIGEIRNVKDVECSVEHTKNSDGNNMEKEGDDEIDPDVEIIDDAAVLKKGSLSSFVPSKIFHISMEDADSQNLGGTSVCDVFRKEVLDVLAKQFDKEELKKLREAVRDGSYYHYYPDLGRKLKRFRYKREKCLNILRGFFFWLQNVSQEGSFKPWKDGQCLAVEPRSPKGSPPPRSTYMDRAKQSKRKILE